MNDPTIAGGMRSNRHPLDDASATRLLQGAVHPDDAPPGYASVADLLATAASLPAVDEDTGAPTISAMVEAIRASAPAPETPRRKTMLGKILAGKALVAVGLALTAGGAAAATGTLPDQAQAVVSDAVSHVGVNLPHPNHGKSADHRKDGEHRQDGKNDQSGDDQGQPGSTDQADNNGQKTSGAAHDAKADAKENGTKVGPAVCTAVGSNCPPKQEAGSGSDDEGTPPTTGSDDDQSDQRGKSTDDHGRDDDHATTPTTGSIATGEDHSGKEDLPVSDKGKAGSDD